MKVSLTISGDSTSMQRTLSRLSAVSDLVKAATPIFDLLNIHRPSWYTAQMHRDLHAALSAAKGAQITDCLVYACGRQPNDGA